VHVALTGRREAYYTDYLGSTQELISSAKYGFLYQGQWYRWQKKRRGTPALGLAPYVFVHYLQNHDQIANSAFGKRIHELTSPGRYRALSALLLLGRATPLLFQGQEFNASAPFLFFADLPESLREPVAEGRKEFLSQFPALADADAVAALAPPGDALTFARCRLDLTERQKHAGAYMMHRDLVGLRRTDPVIAAERTRVDGALIASHAFLLRFFGADEDRLLVINLGCDLDPTPVPEPLLAPPEGCQWRLLWSSEAVAYGGGGTPPVNPNARWHIPSESAVLLGSEPQSSDDASG
jgi:maltooligosyltrehalose trehalohydrolase